MDDWSETSIDIPSEELVEGMDAVCISGIDTVSRIEVTAWVGFRLSIKLDIGGKEVVLVLESTGSEDVCSDVYSEWYHAGVELTKDTSMCEDCMFTSEDEYWTSKEWVPVWIYWDEGDSENVEDADGSVNNVGDSVEDGFPGLVAVSFKWFPFWLPTSGSIGSFLSRMKIITFNWNIHVQ